MPAPGDQHKFVANPFQERVVHLSEYTAQDIATLQSRLEKQLGPEYLSARTGPSGQKVHYIAAEKVIGLANEIFGFNGWSSSIQNVQVDFVEEHPQTFKISLGLSVIVRVTLRDGTYHEDIGYGHIENCKGKAAAFEKAKKEGTTDGLKRALRNFGNVLGNCIYDKAYVDRVSRLKVSPTRKFDERGLHRHADYAAKSNKTEDTPRPHVPAPAPAAPAATTPATVLQPKPEPATDAGVFMSDSFDEDLLGDFDEADFSVPQDGHPDEVVLPEATAIPPLPPPAYTPSRSVSPVRQPTLPQQQQQQQQQASHQGGRPPVSSKTNGAEEGGTPWLSARAVAKTGGANAAVDAVAASSIQPVHLFNPKAESPSIRKTPGIDHNRSKPVPRISRPQPGGPARFASGSVGTNNAVPAASGGAAGTAGTSKHSSTPLMASTATAAAAAAAAAAATTTPGGSTAVTGQPMRAMTPMGQADLPRRIGAPLSAASPLANRGQFRPPPMKRPGDATLSSTSAAANSHAPLADLSTNVSVAVVGDGVDAKRQRLA